MPLNDTHLEPIVNQMNPLYIIMPGFCKLEVIVVCFKVSQVGVYTGFPTEVYTCRVFSIRAT